MLYVLEELFCKYLMFQYKEGFALATYSKQQYQIQSEQLLSGMKKKKKPGEYYQEKEDCEHEVLNLQMNWDQVKCGTLSQLGLVSVVPLNFGFLDLDLIDE